MTAPAKTWIHVLLLLAFAGGGFVVGVATREGREPESPALGRALAERDAATLRAERAEAEVSAMRDPRRRVRPGSAPHDRPGGAPAGVTGGAGVTGDTVPAGASNTAEASPVMDPAAARERVNALRGQMAAWFEKGQGSIALAALRELAALAPDVPEARELAMQLALDMNRDAKGEGRLGLSEFAFYKGMEDPRVRDLMLWSLANPSPAGFREFSAWSIPWSLPAERTIDVFTVALAQERDHAVQRAIVVNLAGMKNPRADAVLADVFRDEDRAATLRAEAALGLAATRDAAVVRSLEEASSGDADPLVRDAARAALVLRSPTATGFLITSAAPQSGAEEAGLHAGDIVVSYAGRAVVDPAGLSEAIGATSGPERVPVVVVRDGREATLLVRPGPLGVQGRGVERK